MYAAFLEEASSTVLPFDAAYRGRLLFPLREDDSIFISLAAFRDHVLGQTLMNAYRAAQHPERLYVGAVVNNCFFAPCKTGAQVVGKNAQGRDMTKVGEVGADANGIEEFCGNPEFAHHCAAGRVRVLYVNESEALGPAMARYYASKLWAGETFFMQVRSRDEGTTPLFRRSRRARRRARARAHTRSLLRLSFSLSVALSRARARALERVDAHLRFAPSGRQVHRRGARVQELPKAVLSSYPPGFTGGAALGHAGRAAVPCGSRRRTSTSIIRINVGRTTHAGASAPTQIAFIAAGFFFARAEFLRDVPFDPLLPWCFMGEEIALSTRAWTAGWDIYAPRENLIAHEYRPGRMGLPKFWGSVGRVFGRPGFNTPLMLKVVQRVKHMIGYPDSALERLTSQGDVPVLTDLEFYGMGHERTLDEYLKLTGIDVEKKICPLIKWCSNEELL